VCLGRGRGKPAIDPLVSPTQVVPSQFPRGPAGASLCDANLTQSKIDKSCPRIQVQSFFQGGLGFIVSVRHVQQVSQAGMIGLDGGKYRASKIEYFSVVIGTYKVDCASHAASCSVTPTCGAARPTLGASRIVSRMSWTSRCISSERISSRFSWCAWVRKQVHLPEQFSVAWFSIVLYLRGKARCRSRTLLPTKHLAPAEGSL